MPSIDNFLEVKGRGRLTASVEYAGESFVIRLDDEWNPEFWAEIKVNREAIYWYYIRLLRDVYQVLCYVDPAIEPAYRERLQEHMRRVEDALDEVRMTLKNGGGDHAA